MRLLCAVGLLFWVPELTAADLTLRESVEAALRGYPSVRVAVEAEQGAGAEVRLAHSAYLPRLDGLAQFNRATHNNVSGLLLPQAIISPISGPVLGTNDLRSVWGSAAGALFTWEPIDFGARRAAVAAAEAGRSVAAAGVERSRLETAFAAAAAFLTLVAAQESARAARAAVERSEVLVRSTAALVSAQLRPGADTARAEAELAAARTQLIQAEGAAAAARAFVAQYTGLDPASFTVRAGRILTTTPDPHLEELDLNETPLEREQRAAVEQARARLRAVQRTLYPRLAFQASAYSRGTGADVNGRNLGGLNGLAPDTKNYAAAVTVTFPFLDFASVHAREAGHAAALREEQARYEQVRAESRARESAARAALDAALKVAGNTPAQVAAAAAVLRQATARYEAGLSGVIEVAEAQRLLTQAEIDNALARLGTWRALLALAFAQGSIEPFLTEASR